MSPPARRATSLDLEGGRRTCGEPAQTQGKTSRLHTQKRLQVRDSNPQLAKGNVPLRCFQQLKEQQVKLSTAASWRVALGRHSSKREPGSPTRSCGGYHSWLFLRKTAGPFGKCQRFHFLVLGYALVAGVTFQFRVNHPFKTNTFPSEEQSRKPLC